MKPRELGGAIRASEEVFVWVALNRWQGMWLQISKSQARDIVDEAKVLDCEIVRAVVDGKSIEIGGDDELPEEENMPEPPDDAEEEEELIEEEEEEDVADGEEE